MPGARLIRPSPDSRRPLARADPQGVTGFRPACDLTIRNASPTAASYVSLITRSPPEHPAPGWRRGLSPDSPGRGTLSRPLAVASTHLPARRRAFSPGRDDICPPTTPTGCRVTAECTGPAQSTAGRESTPKQPRPEIPRGDGGASGALGIGRHPCAGPKRGRLRCHGA